MSESYVLTTQRERARLIARLQEDLRAKAIYLMQPTIEILLDAYDARRE